MMNVWVLKHHGGQHWQGIQCFVLCSCATGERFIAQGTGTGRGIRRGGRVRKFDFRSDGDPLVLYIDPNYLSPSYLESFFTQYYMDNPIYICTLRVIIGNIT